MPDSNPSDYSRSAEGHEDVLTSLMLQRHRVALIQVLVISVISRLISVGIAVYVTLLAHLSAAQAIAAVAVAATTAIVWRWGNRSTRLELEGIEETISREIGGRELDFYIASRSNSYRYRRGPAYKITAYEPFVWILINGIVLIVSVLINGLGGWHGLGN